MALNTIISVVPLLFITLLKLIIPIKSWGKLCVWLLIKIAENWMSVNSFALSLSGRIQIDLRGAEGLHYHGWYLVSCNHQSWSDILILQQVFNRRIPMLKFFLK